MLGKFTRSRFLSKTPYSIGLLLFTLIVSCGANPVCKESTGVVGSCCKVKADCNDGLNCFTQFPAGYCSLDCEADRVCPQLSHCVRIESHSMGTLGYLCLTDCGENLPACRQAYSCQKASSSGIYVCFPD